MAKGNAGSKFLSATARPRCLWQVLNLDGKGQAVANVDDQHLPVAHLLDGRQQLFRLLPQQKVIETILGTGRIVRADLQLPNHAWRWVEHWRSIPHQQILDPAEVDLLHQLDKSLLRP